ncbi:diacylglycerol kinase [Helicobacter saguini]|uniref:Diacylglycerol kinase n=1 Tax=Helicobacter saguini TaxID=1548018 RepID=A0A6L7DDL2_9HELI|nr:diacylglycerol kinase [Helicobacter saguini]MWV62391.1 diacylglycerol kinase [Helicobacter saguini]MWV69285.1 diacylglycerol kinase [Helicobacter saguini]MWV71159.1 diacylglycerol kinase [Helicobacter saguini]
MKPKYNLFSNAKYAFDGLKSMVKTEMAFRLELFFATLGILLSFALNITLQTQILLIITLFLILIMECVNSAIESSIDLFTQDYAKLAKIAKDCGSAAVLLCVLQAILCWGSC